MFHPAKRDCLSNEEVWRDGFCPLLTAVDDDDAEGEDEKGDDDKDGDVDEEDDEKEEAAMRKENRGTRAKSAPTTHEEEADEMASIQIKVEHVLQDQSKTPNGAELEDPVRA